MTPTGIVISLVVGLVVGALTRLVIPGRERVPHWLTLTIGVVAALLGAIAARLAGVDGLGVPGLIIQVGLAAGAVVLVVATAGRDRADSA